MLRHSRAAFPALLAALAWPALSCLAIARDRPPTSAPSAAGKPAAAAKSAESHEPAIAPAKTAFEKLSESERRAIHDALIWTGDYAGVADGVFGKRTYEGIVAFQTRAGLTPSGILDGTSGAMLREAAAGQRKGADFRLESDPRAGIRIGVPHGLVGEGVALPLGTRFASADRTVTLETAVAAAGAGLPALFESFKAEAAGRKVTYSLLRPDFFVVAGEQDGRRFYIRYGAGPAGLRGFAFAYPAARAASLDRVMIAIANSFEPFAGSPPPPAALEPRLSAAALAAPKLAPPSAPTIPPAAPVSPPRPQGPLATGVIVAPGRVLTAADLAGCAAPTAGGKAARILRGDAALGLTLLDAPVKGQPLAAGVARPPEPGAGIVAVGFGSEGSLDFAAGEAARAPDGGPRFIGPLPAAGAGGPVFDRAGGLVGFVRGLTPRQSLVAGIVPAAIYPLAAAAEAGTFTGQAFPPAADAGVKSAGVIAAGARGSLAAIDCAR